MNSPALLYLLEVATERVPALVRRRVVHDRRGLPSDRVLLLLALRARVFVLLTDRVVLLSLLTPIYVILQLYPHLSFCWLVPVKYSKKNVIPSSHIAFFDELLSFITHECSKVCFLKLEFF